MLHGNEQHHVKKEIERYRSPILDQENFEKDVRQTVDFFQRQHLDVTDYVLVEQIDAETLTMKLVWRKKQ